MEKARRKIRLCLIFVAALAVAAGLWYYLPGNESSHANGGTLVENSSMPEISWREENILCRQ